jgi:hypothetical protein
MQELLLSDSLKPKQRTSLISLLRGAVHAGDFEARRVPNSPNRSLAEGPCFIVSIS